VARHNVFREDRVHVLAEECATCIFRPHTRPVNGERVAGMVRETINDPGATVVCHSTLYRGKPKRHAICRGWYDRLADRDPILGLAQAMGMIVFDPVPDKEKQ